MTARAASVLLLVSQALAAYTVGELLMRIFPEPHNELVSAPAFVIIALIAFLAPAAFDWFAVGGGRRALGLGAIGLIALSGALRLQYAHDFALWDFRWAYEFVVDTGAVRDLIAPVAVSALLLVVTWAWAAWRASDGPSFENAPRAMVIPFAVVTLALLLAVGSEQAAVVARGGVVFYGVALAALACAQLSRSDAGIGALRSGGVTTVMLAGVAAFAVLGVLLVGVLLDPLVDLLGPPALAALKAIAWFVTWAIFFPIAWLLTNLMELVLSLFGGGEAEPREVELPAQVVEGEGAGSEDGEASLASRVLRYTLAGGAIFLGIAAVAGLIFFLAFLRRRTAEAEAGAPESARAGDFGDDLRDAVRGLFRRERRRTPGGEGAVRLYLEVLESARREGVERPEGQTAHEFAPVLLGALHRDVTDEITAAFEAARYAGRPPRESALADLRRRWEARG